MLIHSTDATFSVKVQTNQTRSDEKESIQNPVISTNDESTNKNEEESSSESSIESGQRSKDQHEREATEKNTDTNTNTQNSQLPRVGILAAITAKVGKNLQSGALMTQPTAAKKSLR
jgi:acetyl/propionyl-CoA carboxylase alpha subunit